MEKQARKREYEQKGEQKKKKKLATPTPAKAGFSRPPLFFYCVYAHITRGSKEY